MRIYTVISFRVLADYFKQAGYEEATRALFAGELGRLRECVGQWPRDIRNHTLTLAEAAPHKDEGACEDHPH